MSYRTIELGGAYGYGAPNRRHFTAHGPGAPAPEDAAERAREFQAKKGRRAWNRIHRYRGKDPQYVELWEEMIPNTCACEGDYREILKTHKWDYSSEDALFESGIAIHNAVNYKLNKAPCSLPIAYALWRDQRLPSDRTRCIVTVATGTEFLKLLETTGPLMAEYASRCNADFIPLTNETQAWWGLEKFRTWHFAKQYEETLFLDADCIVTKSAPDMFSAFAGASVACHDDWSRLKTHGWLTAERQTVARLSGRKIDNDKTCFNSGVVYCTRHAADVWKPPTEKIGTTHCAEQIIFEQQVKQITGTPRSIPSQANWQAYFDDFDAGVSEAWVIHLANATDRIGQAKRLAEQFA